MLNAEELAARAAAARAEAAAEGLELVPGAQRSGFIERARTHTPCPLPARPRLGGAALTEPLPQRRAHLMSACDRIVRVQFRSGFKGVSHTDWPDHWVTRVTESGQVAHATSSLPIT